MVTLFHNSKLCLKLSAVHRRDNNESFYLTYNHHPFIVIIFTIMKTGKSKTFKTKLTMIRRTILCILDPNKHS